jgi:transposase
MEPVSGYTQNDSSAGLSSWPKPADAKNGKLSLDPAALAMLTDGIDLRDGMRHAWFERE